MAPSRLSCFLIGSDTLLTACGDVLLGGGHDVAGVVSDTPRVIDWARDKGITVTDLRSDFVAVLRRRPFDYLFSIAYLALVPAEALATPRGGAINFHDGPLPAYAGLNTPAWGILNGETTWGITWHLMTTQIDAGDILLQRTFEVAPDETALSLNTKCFAAALESFPELVASLAAGSAAGRRQEKAGQYYGKHRRPAAAAVIDWNAPAAAVERMVRALDFGPYANALGAPKVVKGGKVLLVTRAELGESSPNGAPPGTVLALDGEGIDVACGEGVARLRALATPSGDVRSPAEAARELSLVSGARFDVLSPALRDRLSSLTPSLSRAEAFWERRLAALEPVDLPYAVSRPKGDSADPASIPVPIPASFRERFSDDPATALVAAYAVYLAHLGGKERFSLALADGRWRRVFEGLDAVVATGTPLSIAIDPSDDFPAVLARVGAELRAGAQAPYLIDLVARTPQLRRHPALTARPLLPVGIALDLDGDGAAGAASILTLVLSDGGSGAALRFDARRLSPESARIMADQLAHVLEALAADPTRAVSEVDLLTAARRRQVLDDWNRTDRPYRRDLCVHELIDEQVARTPDATAVVGEGGALSYRALDQRAERLAGHLRGLGVGPDALVGIFVDRSVDLVVAVLATLKAGGAYLPLDPSYPAERLALMLEDSRAGVVITQDHLAPSLPPHDAHVVSVSAAVARAAAPVSEPASASPENLAYVIYTSGSTGRPKGVEIEHRNVLSFFAAMDDRIDAGPGSSWIAVTSLSFDIHVLEILWPLTRGATVVVYRDTAREHSPAGPRASAKEMGFGLFLWGQDDSPGPGKYDLMLQGARFLDEHGFTSVWTPERHFHAFGGPYPNPSVTGAALASVTKRLQIRAGSCVSPLHHPIRIAEEWAVVDNISNGRVGISFAAGWQPNDFVLRPENQKKSRAVMLEQIDVVRRLWRGERLSFPDAEGRPVEVTTLPRPVQAELPFWVTTAGNPQTWRDAGALGANVLTHLLGQSVEEMREKVALYRAARAENGHDPDEGVVTLMLHTFVSEDATSVRPTVRGPMKEYLRTSVSLLKGFAWAFPAFKRPKGLDPQASDVDFDSLSPEELDAILEFAFERYFETSGLFGTPESCLPLVERLKAIGVDEIACLLDYGIPTQDVLASLPALARLRTLANPDPASAAAADGSIPALVRRHHATHLQCTPSMARMLLADEEGRRALGAIEHLLVGGEALPVPLAAELRRTARGRLTNMYGPTETTVWSSTYEVRQLGEQVPIGRPIANTRIYILDSDRRPTPVGVPGEVYIAGHGVARGYRNRAELTAERFVPDPFQEANARMYRTGDLARFQQDGVIEFLGRIDNQVKVRGHRIELGEIETALSRHPSVREAVVSARQDTPDDQRLVAYVVPREGRADTEALRAHLRAILPEHMVPSHVVVLSVLPLTPNGKVDRGALPAPETLEERKAAAVAPASEIEASLAGLWREVLARDEVGVEDNFFDLGGHSLLVVRLHRRIREALPGTSLALTDLYRFPTVRSLGGFLSAADAPDAAARGAARAQQRLRLRGQRRGPR